MSRRLACSVLVLAALGAAASAASAGESPVWVDRGPGYVGVGSGVGRTPLVGAHVDYADPEVCVGFGYQVPICTELSR